MEETNLNEYEGKEVKIILTPNQQTITYNGTIKKITDQYIIIIDQNKKEIIITQKDISQIIITGGRN